MYLSRINLGNQFMRTRVRGADVRKIEAAIATGVPVEALSQDLQIEIESLKPFYPKKKAVKKRVVKKNVTKSDTDLQSGNR
jgi:ribosomal protein S20